MISTPGQLLYGHRSHRVARSSRIISSLETMNYEQLHRLIMTDLLPAPLRRAFPEARFVGRAKVVAPAQGGPKTVACLSGVVPQRQLVMSLYRSDTDQVISLDYEAQMNLLTSDQSNDHFIATLASVVDDEQVLIEVCSTSPNNLQTLFNRYPPGWRLGRYLYGRSSDHERLQHLANTVMLSPEDSRLLAGSKTLDQAWSGQASREALLNCNQYVPIYLVRPLNDFQR